MEEGRKVRLFFIAVSFFLPGLWSKSIIQSWGEWGPVLFNCFFIIQYLFDVKMKFKWNWNANSNSHGPTDLIISHLRCYLTKPPLHTCASRALFNLLTRRWGVLASLSPFELPVHFLFSFSFFFKILCLECLDKMIFFLPLLFFK